MDTGMTQRLVHSNYVANDDTLDGSISICACNGEKNNHPVVPAVDVDRVTAIVHTGVSPNLPQSAVIE